MTKHLARPILTAARLGLLVLATALLGLPAVFAGDEGLYIETVNRTSGLMGESPTEEVSKTYVAYGKMKVVSSQPDGANMILDPASGTMTFVNDTAKQYYQIDLKSMMEGMSQPGMEQMRAMMEQTRIKVEKTGETRKIGDWDCTKYEVTKTGMMEIQQEIWATTDVDIDLDRYTEMMSMSGPDGLLGDSEAAKSMRAEMEKIEGYPILTKTKMQMMGSNMESESEVTVIRKESVPESMFEIPSDYTKKDMMAPPSGQPHP
ncbi:DUF4412 domain-containing protein [Imhoffiella purpurea]|uniref:DUF4412 domain-containing protein n=1 Tax=Imhoffiella purpurea TaxID=1249627 RepID=W9V7Z7_9GAMM|nr:DUF4412 domain-containing protein [Imhoffiella purpurea]EXJ15549.1 hypothetical protein D779_1291 [Imhoffiella purpurea]